MPRRVGSFLGEWWLPRTPMHRVPGILHIAQRGDLRLETTASLEGDDVFGPGSLETYSVVHGRTGGDDITLLDVIQSDDYSPGACLIGAALTRDEFRVRRLRVAFDDLSLFTRASGLDRTITGESVTDSWKRPVSRQAHVGEGAKVELTFSWSGPQSRTRLAIEETAYFEVRVDTPLDIEAFSKRHIWPIRQLVSLAFGESVAPSVVEIFTPLVTFSVGSDVFEQPLELILPVVHPDLTDPAKRPMFSLDDLPGGFEGGLPRWYQLARALEPALGIYFGAHYGRPKYRDDELLLLILAAESYHRLSRFPQKTSSKDDVRWQAVLESAPTDQREWLSGRIEQALERRLRERLYDIAEYPGPFGREVANRIPGFQMTLANWRNRLVHHDSKDDSGRLSGGHMAHACFVLRCLLTGCLLRDLGVEEAKIDDMLRTSRIGRYALEWNPGK